MLITLLLSQSLPAFADIADNCPMSGAAEVSAEMSNSEMSVAEHAHCAGDEGAANKSFPEDFFEEPSDTSQESCSIECESCASGGFPLTCDRLALAEPEFIAVPVNFASVITPGVANPLYRPPIRS
jgi:hypothetical protein